MTAAMGFLKGLTDPQYFLFDYQGGEFIPVSASRSIHGNIVAVPENKKYVI